MEVIPPMTNPLGRYWQQPPASEIAIDDAVAMMSTATFKLLGEYSTSIPSGKYQGKMWKARRGSHWYLRWYLNDPQDQNTLLIPCRLIVIVDNADAQPFVILSASSRPHLVKRLSDGDWWLCYWHDANKHFVTLQTLTLDEVELYRQHALPQAQADLYMNYHKRVVDDV